MVVVETWMAPLHLDFPVTLPSICRFILRRDSSKKKPVSCLKVQKAMNFHPVREIR
jgi:hypothetical protein